MFKFRLRCSLSTAFIVFNRGAWMRFLNLRHGYTSLGIENLIMVISGFSMRRARFVDLTLRCVILLIIEISGWQLKDGKDKWQPGKRSISNYRLQVDG